MIYIEKLEEGGNIYYDKQKQSLSLDNERRKLHSETAKRTEELKQKMLDTLSKEEDIMRKRRDEKRKDVEIEESKVKEHQKDFQDRVGNVFYIREPYGFFGKYGYDPASDKYKKINSNTSSPDSSLLFNIEDVGKFIK